MLLITSMCGCSQTECPVKGGYFVIVNKCKGILIDRNSTCPLFFSVVLSGLSCPLTFLLFMSLTLFPFLHHYDYNHSFLIFFTLIQCSLSLSLSLSLYIYIYIYRACLYLNMFLVSNHFIAPPLRYVQVAVGWYPLV